MRPLSSYARLAAAGEPGRWRDVLRRLALTALILGTAIAIHATGRATLDLVLSVSLSWSFVPALQCAAGALLILSAPRRPVSLVRALDLFFAGHLPWSLWLLGVTAVIALVRPPFDTFPVLVSLLVPLVWTAAIIVAFGRSVLQLATRAALARALLHQALLWGGGALFFIWMTDSWLRLRALLVP